MPGKKPPVEKFCPVCKSKNRVEAASCEVCGAPLDQLVQPHRTTVPMEARSKVLSASEAGLDRLRSRFVPQQGLAIYIMGDSKPIVTLEGGELILGRQTPEGPSNICDLSAHGAFELGVSRQHCLIRQAREGYELIDLNSTNGTWLNEVQLVPNRPYLISGNLQLRLGKMGLFLVHAARAEK